MPNFLRNWKLFSREVTILHTHQQWMRSPIFLHPPQNLLLPVFLIIAILGGMNMVVLIYIYLIFHYAEHNFRPLLPQRVSSWKKHLVKFLASFLIELFSFLLLNCNCFLYIWNSSPLSNILIFSTSLWAVFLFSWCSHL